MIENGVTWKHAAGCGGLVFVVAYAALRLWSTRGHAMPNNSWFALGVLVLMIALVLVGGWDIRRYLQGQSTRMPTPMRARRTLVAGQACALGGSAVAAWYVAHAAVDARSLDVPSVQDAFWMAVLLAAGALGLVAAGFVVQSWCRIPDDDDQERRRRRGSGGGGALGA
ncbi:DUF3180 domain-containing protein [Leekyejoonella antrihumi]|uniref:DUF3180 domain-containing protein n=1 Tax=Leekyejoonella antrihumi TaxID=1660198 RepID=UPI0016488AA5|nr:DUF3180 domain-containing protein [Leekyejoonella antrihumi]